MPEAESRPLLLVVAHGVGSAEFGALASNVVDLAAAAPIELPAEPMATFLEECDASPELRDLGVAVDRTGLVLRPRGRTDATVVEAVGRRTTGTAPVTILESTDVLAAAEVGGTAAAIAAARQLGALLTTARERLRRGDAPEIWFVGCGSAEPVVAMFDFAAAWRQRITAQLADDLHVDLGPSAATIVAANQRALDLATTVLSRNPFATRGQLEERTTGNRLVFRAHHRVAFGDHPVAARRANTRTLAGIVAAPIGDTVRQRGLPFADLVARFWMRAAAMHVVEPITTPASAPMANANTTTTRGASAPVPTATR